ncbi:HAD-IIIA family hydrolase [Microbaculum marinum]|uniref:HAD-IIIA family hydrolase n=1 Tax=Microbaculum marinum TaxID=1764581 RepID=UPI0036167051
MAGGRGTRMAGVADDLPKALVAVGGKPVLQHQLECAAASGIEAVTIFAGHLAHRIAAFVGDGSRFGLRVKVEVETTPLGTAGAVLQALDTLPEHFFIVYGDVMLAVDLAAMGRRHVERTADFTTFVHPNDHPHDSDLLEIDEQGWVVAVYRYPHPEGVFLPNLVNAALYVARRDALRSIGRGGNRDFMQHVLAPLGVSGRRVLAYRSREYVKDMGTPDRLEQVTRDLRDGKLDRGAAHLPAPTVFLDRDGTINEERGFLASHDELELVPGAGRALRRLRDGGFRLLMVTNQPVIARGDACEEEVDTIHRRLAWELGKHGAYLDDIYLCPHHPDSGFPGERPELKGPCDCRKPGTGMFERARRDHPLDVGRSWMVGDRTADIEFARRTGLRSILVRTGAAGKDGKYAAVPNHVAADLGEAAEIVLASTPP